MLSSLQWALHTLPEQENTVLENIGQASGESADLEDIGDSGLILGRSSGPGRRWRVVLCTLHIECQLRQLGPESNHFRIKLLSFLVYFLRAKVMKRPDERWGEMGGRWVSVHLCQRRFQLCLQRLERRFQLFPFLLHLRQRWGRVGDDRKGLTDQTRKTHIEWVARRQQWAPQCGAPHEAATQQA
jgi:hypothetical protein